MTRKRSRLLVIDASVLQSAGETEHPVSSACRKCLEAILLICHRVAVTPGINEEWKRHRSRFSRKWRRFMAGKKKPLEIVPPASVPINIDGYANPAKEAIEKDFRLLEAALAADRILVTRDDSLRSALMERADGKALLESIKWINPVTDGREAIEAL